MTSTLILVTDLREWPECSLRGLHCATQGPPGVLVWLYLASSHRVLSPEVTKTRPERADRERLAPRLEAATWPEAAFRDDSSCSM